MKHVSFVSTSDIERDYSRNLRQNFNLKEGEIHENNKQEIHRHLAATKCQMLTEWKDKLILREYALSRFQDMLDAHGQNANPRKLLRRIRKAAA